MVPAGSVNKPSGGVPAFSAFVEQCRGDRMIGGEMVGGARWLVLAAAAVLAGGGAGPAPAAVVAPVAVVPVAVVPADAPVERVETGGSGSVPVRLRIPVLGVDAAVEPVATDGSGVLGVPDDPQVVGWWSAGGAPGVPGGAGVLDGHVDTAAQGPGALFRLAALRPGDAVSVTTAGGIVSTYVVRAVHRFPKSAFRSDLFAPGGAPRLVVVTCGGQFDPTTRHYVDNVAIVAYPAAE